MEKLLDMQQIHIFIKFIICIIHIYTSVYYTHTHTPMLQSYVQSLCQEPLLLPEDIFTF